MEQWFKLGEISKLFQQHKLDSIEKGSIKGLQQSKAQYDPRE